LDVRDLICLKFQTSGILRILWKKVCPFVTAKTTTSTAVRKNAINFLEIQNPGGKYAI